MKWFKSCVLYKCPPPPRTHQRRVVHFPFEMKYFMSRHTCILSSSHFLEGLASTTWTNPPFLHPVLSLGWDAPSNSRPSKSTIVQSCTTLVVEPFPIFSLCKCVLMHAGACFVLHNLRLCVDTSFCQQWRKTQHHGAPALAAHNLQCAHLTALRLQTPKEDSHKSHG